MFCNTHLTLLSCPEQKNRQQNEHENERKVLAL
jgi:hypothetical protein